LHMLILCTDQKRKKKTPLLLTHPKMIRNPRNLRSLRRRKKKKVNVTKTVVLKDEKS